MADFFDKLGINMDIPKALWESKAHFSHRLILSSASAWMMTVVHAWGEPVSIDHVKAVTRSKVDAMADISGSLNNIDIPALVDYIYEQLLDNGVFYHTPYNLRPVPRRLIYAGNIALVRGMLPEEDVQFSGMAPFIMITDACENNAVEAFGLPETEPELMLQQTWKRLTSCSIPAVAEYLNANRRAGNSYYSNRRQNSDDFTLARESQGINQYVYYLIKGNEAKRLNDDLADAHVQDYCRLAIMNAQKRQSITATIGKQLVRVEIGYLLPAPELRFLRYISWPEALPEYDQPWRFALRPQLWPMLKERLEFLKYAVEEQDE